MVLLKKLRQFAEDMWVFIRATIILLHADPYKKDREAYEKRYNEYLKSETEKYRASLEADHEPDEIEGQMIAAKSLIRRKAKVFAHSFEPTETEKILNRFHEALGRYPTYISIMFSSVFIVNLLIILFIVFSSKISL